jgi:membrane fusion protein, multidrug efflux system
MEPTSSGVAEPNPQPETRAPKSQSPQSDRQPDSQSRYQRRAAFLSHPRTKWGLILAGLVILVAIFFLWRYLASYESTDDAQIDGHVNSVSARVSGHVIELNVQDNQYVEKGTVLVEIDPADYEVAAAQARAEYADAQAQAAAAGINVPITDVSTSSQVRGAQGGVSGAQAGIAAARQQFEAAKSQVAEADANNTKAQNDLLRYKLLIDKQEIKPSTAPKPRRPRCKRRAPMPTPTRRRSNRRRANWSRPTPISGQPATRRRPCEPPAPARNLRRPLPIRRRPHWIRLN